MYHQYQLYSLHGQSKDALAKTKVGAWEYDIIGPWYKCNMTDIMAAIGLNTNIVKLVKTGGKPLIMGFCCWIGITGVSLLMQHLLGLF